MKRASLALTLLLVPALARAADPVKPWKGDAPKGVTSAHLAMPLTEEENYNDRYTVEAWFEDGTRAYVSVLVNNFGPGQGKMTAKARWHERSGQEHKTSKDLQRGQYKVSAEPFSVDAGSVHLGGSPRSFKVKAEAGGYSFDLTFASGLAPWRPGTGRTTFGAGDLLYFDTTLVQPKAQVTGTVSGPGGKGSVKGYGYVIHTIGNIAPYAMYKRILEVRALDGEYAVYLKQFTTPEQYGGKNVGFLYVAKDGKPLVATTNYAVKYGAWQTDSKHENKYKVPFQIVARAKRGDTTVEVTVDATKFASREDVLQGLSTVERVLVQQFAKPVQYQMETKVTVTVTGADGQPVSTTEPASYELAHLNK